MAMIARSSILKAVPIESDSASDHSLFLTVSGNRVGSTYLEFMLDCLPDVRTDYEFQWRKSTRTPLHIALDTPGFDLSSKLTEIAGDSYVGGSKLVVPPEDDLGVKDFKALRRALISELSLVHIGRRYLDSYLSKLMNLGHLRNPEGIEPKNEIHIWLQESLKDDLGIPGNGKLSVDEDDLLRDLKKRYRHDALFFSLNDGSRPYMYVEYSEIESKFEEIVAFISSNATGPQISKILKSPPTKMLPRVEFSDHLENYTRVCEIGDYFESKRQRLIRCRKNRTK